MCQLTGQVGKNAGADFDQGSLYLKLLDSGSEVVGGCYFSSSGNTTYQEGFSTVAIVPPTATSAEIWGYMAKENAGTANNGTVDAVKVRWKTSGPPWTLGSNLIVNGDFETGDFTGWNNSAGTGVISTDTAYVCVGTYAAIGGTQPGGTYDQTFAVDGLATGALATAWMVSTGTAQDEVRLTLIWNGADGGDITNTYTGPMSMTLKAFSSYYNEIPSGATSVTVQFRFIRRIGTTNNVGIDAITFQWVY
jgi:hypothetical protein